MMIKYLQRVCHNIFCRIASSGANDILQRRTRYTHTCLRTFNLRIIETNIISTTLATTCLWLHKMIPHSFLFIYFVVFFNSTFSSRKSSIPNSLLLLFSGKRMNSAEVHTHTLPHFALFTDKRVWFPRLSCSLASSLLLVMHERQFQRE